MKLKPVLLYILFFIAAILVFFFLLFPKKEVAEYLSKSLAGPYSDQNVIFSVDQVNLCFPVKFCFENPVLVIDNAINIVPESLEVFLGPAFFFSAEKPVRFQSDIYQGSLNGRLYLKSFSPLLFSRTQISMSKVKISNLSYKTSLADIILNCELNGEHNYVEADKTSEKNGKPNSGQGIITIQNFSADIKASLFNKLNLPIVDFSDIKLEYTMDRETVTVKQCVARGSIINVKLIGRVDIVHPLQESRLNFKGVILPDSPYLAKFANMAQIKSAAKNILINGLNFNINGTLKNPNIYL